MDEEPLVFLTIRLSRVAQACTALATLLDALGEDQLDLCTDRKTLDAIVGASTLLAGLSGDVTRLAARLSEVTS